MEASICDYSDLPLGNSSYMRVDLIGAVASENSR